MPTIAETVRWLRPIQLTFILSVCLFVFAGEKIITPGRPDFPAALLYGILILAGSNIIIAVLFRYKTAGQAEEILRRNPDDAVALNRWRAGQLISYCMAESVGLFGFVLRVLGAPFARSIPFYGAAMLLLILFQPKDPR